MLVKVNHNGFIAGVAFEKGDVIDLPETSLKALGVDAYVVMDGAKAEEKKVEKSENKAVKNAKNK